MKKAALIAAATLLGLLAGFLLMWLGHELRLGPFGAWSAALDAVLADPRGRDEAFLEAVTTDSEYAAATRAVWRLIAFGLLPLSALVSAFAAFALARRFAEPFGSWAAATALLPAALAALAAPGGRPLAFLLTLFIGLAVTTALSRKAPPGGLSLPPEHDDRA